MLTAFADSLPALHGECQDDKMGVATAVLCVLRFPAATQGTDAMQAGAEPSSLDTAAQHPGNSYEYALRSAVQLSLLLPSSQRYDPNTCTFCSNGVVRAGKPCVPGQPVTAKTVQERPALVCQDVEQCITSAAL
eukprot:1156678-Pelagomonas_calceolata.AAC.6